MSKKQERIDICKDVLRQVYAKKYTPMHGTYFESQDHEFNDMLYGGWDPATGAHKLPNPEAILTVPKQCSVCALGSVFVSALDRNNTLKLSDKKYLGNSTLMVEYLGEWFTPKQLRLMEMAFEGSDQSRGRMFTSVKRGYRTTTPIGKKAVSFFYKYGKDTRYGDTRSERLMRAIMNNVIRNNGTFKP